MPNPAQRPPGRETAARRMLDHTSFSNEPQVELLVNAMHNRFGDAVEAIVLYGSFTRGQRDTLLDLYVLLSSLEPLSRWQRLLARLPPNVYHLNVNGVRAKVAVMTFAQLQRGVRRDVSPYFWARFAQPSALVYRRDDEVHNRFTRVVAEAQARLYAAAASAPDVPANAADFWEHTFRLTYGAELRSEKPSRYRMLYDANAEYFDEVHAALATEPVGPATSWRVRRITGKLLSLCRLLKSAFTFEDPVDYLLWKIERHSGVRETATRLQHRHPLLFAWPLVWRLYKKGAFR
jgi:predicted nucleotidyltransferase